MALPDVVDVLIIGAGLSGLTAAHALHQAGKTIRVLDARAQPGGLIRSVAEHGFLTEHGPHTFPNTAHELQALCQQLGLTVKAADPAANKRYLYLKGQLVALPTHPLQGLTTPILSFPAKIRLLQELFQPKCAPNGIRQGDISLAEFFQKRFGAELTAHLLDPFISGIYAGDIHALSLPAVFPKLWEWEQGAGSVIRGALQAKKRQRQNKTAVPKPRLQMLSFEQGLQTLTQALEKALPSPSICLGQTVERIQETPEGYRAHTQTGGSYLAKQLVLAVPAPVAAELLQPILPAAATSLASIPYNGLASVQTGFRKADIPHPLDGFGFLVPRREKLPLLGTIWASSLFPERAPQDHVLFSSYIGGAHRPEIVHWEPERILTEVLNNLATVFKTPAPLQPVFSEVKRYAQAIPQYTLGHRERIAALEQSLQGQANIAVCGNYLHGVALNECVKSGQRAAALLAE